MASSTKFQEGKAQQAIARVKAREDALSDPNVSAADKARIGALSRTISKRESAAIIASGRGFETFPGSGVIQLGSQQADITQTVEPISQPKISSNVDISNIFTHSGFAAALGRPDLAPPPGVFKDTPSPSGRAGGRVFGPIKPTVTTGPRPTTFQETSNLTAPIADLTFGQPKSGDSFISSAPVNEPIFGNFRSIFGPGRGKEFMTFVTGTGETKFGESSKVSDFERGQTFGTTLAVPEGVIASKLFFGGTRYTAESKLRSGESPLLQKTKLVATDPFLVAGGVRLTIAGLKGLGQSTKIKTGEQIKTDSKTQLFPEEGTGKDFFGKANIIESFESPRTLEIGQLKDAKFLGKFRDKPLLKFKLKPLKTKIDLQVATRGQRDVPVVFESPGEGIKALKVEDVVGVLGKGRIRTSIGKKVKEEGTIDLFSREDFPVDVRKGLDVNIKDITKIRNLREGSLLNEKVVGTKKVTDRIITEEPVQIVDFSRPTTIKTIIKDLGGRNQADIDLKLTRQIIREVKGEGKTVESFGFKRELGEIKPFQSKSKLENLEIVDLGPMKVFPDVIPGKAVRVELNLARIDAKLPNTGAGVAKDLGRSNLGLPGSKGGIAINLGKSDIKLPGSPGGTAKGLGRPGGVMTRDVILEPATLDFTRVINARLKGATGDKALSKSSEKFLKDLTKNVGDRVKVQDVANRQPIIDAIEKLLPRSKAKVGTPTTVSSAIGRAGITELGKGLAPAPEVGVFPSKFFQARVPSPKIGGTQGGLNQITTKVNNMFTTKVNNIFDTGIITDVQGRPDLITGSGFTKETTKLKTDTKGILETRTDTLPKLLTSLTKPSLAPLRNALLEKQRQIDIQIQPPKQPQPEILLTALRQTGLGGFTGFSFGRGSPPPRTGRTPIAFPFPKAFRLPGSFGKQQKGRKRVSQFIPSLVGLVSGGRAVAPKKLTGLEIRFLQPRKKPVRKPKKRKKRGKK